jgi:hypothetical protein
MPEKSSSASFFALLASSAVAVDNRSVYRERIEDPEAVYFTPDRFEITADGKTDRPLSCESHQPAQKE